MASLDSSPTAVVAAVFDDATEGRLAAEELSSTGLAIGRVRRFAVDKDGPGLDGAGLPAYTVERYRETLRRGRTIVVAKADVAYATAVDAVLRQHCPLETSVHSADDARDDALPPSIRSIAAMTGRPRGHRDPSA